MKNKWKLDEFQFHASNEISQRNFYFSRNANENMSTKILKHSNLVEEQLSPILLPNKGHNI